MTVCCYDDDQTWRCRVWNLALLKNMHYIIPAVSQVVKLVMSERDLVMRDGNKTSVRERANSNLAKVFDICN
jgi:hypothetical protein